MSELVLTGGSVSFLIVMILSYILMAISSLISKKSVAAASTINALILIMILLTSTSLLPALKVGLDTKIRSEDTTAYYAFIEGDYAEVEKSISGNKTVFLGSSMTFDSFDSSCVRDMLTQGYPDIEIFNMAYPGDVLMYRLIDIDYLIETDVKLVAIEMSGWMFDAGDRLLKQGDVQVKLNSRIFLNGASLDGYLLDRPVLQSYLNSADIKTNYLELIPRYFSTDLEFRLGNQGWPETWSPWNNMTSRNGTNRPYDLDFAEGFSDAVTEALSEGKYKKYGGKGINGQNFLNKSLERNNPNLIALEIIIEELLNNGKKIVLYNHPMHHSLERTIGKDWYEIEQGVRDTTVLENEMVSFYNFSSYNNSISHWSDIRHVNSLGKDSLCSDYSQMIANAM